MKLTLADVWDFDNEIRWYVAEERGEQFFMSAWVDHDSGSVTVHDMDETFADQVGMLNYISGATEGGSALLCVRYQTGHVAIQRFS
jgi:hypothetical protein